MLDKGWRRGGNHCYKIVNPLTCCPNFTISCRAIEFKLNSNSMRRCIKRLNTYIMTGQLKGSTDLLMYPELESCSRNSSCARTFSQIEASSKARDRRFVKACLRIKQAQGVELEDAVELVREKWCRYSAGRGNIVPEAITLEDFLFPEAKCEPEHKLTVELVHVNSDQSIRSRDQELEVLQKYQLAIHKEGADEWTFDRYKEFLVDSPIIDEPLRDFDYVDCLDHEQSDQHNSRTKFVDLNGHTEVRTKLLFQPPALPTHYGTYHCVYRLDSKIIAVGVLDILPKCVSTVYLFYNPEYGFLNLGTYTALMEISIVRRLAKRYIGSAQCKLIHYYLGFYVHKCQKMKYKLRFKPSFILCDETKEYVPTEVALAKLEPGIDYAIFSESATRCRDRVDPNFSLADLHKGFVLAPITGTTLDDVSFSGYIYWIRQNIGCLEANIFIDRVLTPLLRTLGRELLLRLILRVHGVHRVLTELSRRPATTTSDSGDSDDS